MNTLSGEQRWATSRIATTPLSGGYGRAEDLAGIVIVATIAASSALAGCEAAARPQPDGGVGPLQAQRDAARA